MNVYLVSGMINAHEVKAKKFKNEKKANSYLSRVLEENNLSVEETYESAKGLEYICNNYSRFAIGKQYVAR